MWRAAQVTPEPLAYFCVYDEETLRAEVHGGVTKWGDGEWHRVVVTDVLARYGGTATLLWEAKNTSLRILAFPYPIAMREIFHNQLGTVVRTGRAGKTEVSLNLNQTIVIEVEGKPHGLFGIEVAWQPGTKPRG